MGRSQKTKRVSWASDINLCQVRLFLSEESPSLVVLGTQDHLQEKASWPLQSGDNEFDDQLPPGFERIQPANLWRLKLSQIPLKKWRCPIKFEISTEWQVVAGEESKEVEAQNQREMRVLEAIYPRPSSIPPNPSGLVDVDNSIVNDKNTPVVPVTPIEDDDAALHTSFHSPDPMILQPQIPSTGITNSLLPNKDHLNLVDRDLLIKILSDPKMVEQLVKNHGASSSGSRNGPSVGMQKSTSSFDAQNKSSNNTITRKELCTLSMAPATGPLYPNPRIRTAPHSPSLGDPEKKDINYYKTLIQQHGREDSLSRARNLNFEKSRESKPKIMKPCIYFNSPKGCRNGAKCAYQHGLDGFPEVQNAKRMKLDGGITGR